MIIDSRQSPAGSRHLLVTNDFPPEVGGIQTYLWELWRRLPTGQATVLTAAHPGSEPFDQGASLPIVRSRRRVLLPSRGLVREVDSLAAQVGACLVVLDPVLPLGLIGPSLRLPYAVVLHGAEVTVPGRLPVSRWALRRVLLGAERVLAAGRYPAAEAERVAGRSLPLTVIPPGVDTEGFRPVTLGERSQARQELGLTPDGRVVVSVSRLVPRKGMDALVRAAARLVPERPDLQVVIGGGGRDRARLDRLVARTGAPVRLVGYQPATSLARLYACADAFALPCRDRWLGLEREGFGIVFLEAAASGLPVVAGDSGGARDAVVDGQTGTVVRHPEDDASVAEALAEILDHPDQRAQMGLAGRRWAAETHTHDALSIRLRSALVEPPPVAGTARLER